MADVSIIMPVYNAAKWLADSITSILHQDFDGVLELSVYNDNSTDETVDILRHYERSLQDRNISLVLGNAGGQGEPNGVGFAKNKAIEQSSGAWLCFFDADDIMLPGRIRLQYKTGLQNPHAIVGCKFRREPQESTTRYTKWANSLTNKQLYTQAYLSHGPTLIMPTWFCARQVYEKVGNFDETGKGTPEDLIFFYKHLELFGLLERVDECLLIYRYHQSATSFSVQEDTIWNLRVEQLQRHVLSKWNSFTIWNAGKQGRKLFRSLSEENQEKVVAFCDVDQKKITKGIYIFEESSKKSKPRIPIIHYSDAKTPFIICVKQDLTGGVLEGILCSLQLREGTDFFHFN